MARDLDMLTTISLHTCDAYNSMAASAFATIATISSFSSEEAFKKMSFAEYRKP